MSKHLQLLVLLPLVVASIVTVRADEPQESARSGDVNGTRTITLERRMQLACGEVLPDATGGFLRYEINLTPSTVERCELEKVGSRLHDCEKHIINVVTTNVHQVNTVYTDRGIVQFWFEDNASIDTANRSGALVFLWPGTNSRFICLPYQ